MRRIAQAFRRSTGLHVTMGFVAILALSLAFGALVSLYPSQQDRCHSQCAELGMAGQLTPKYSLIQAGGNEAKRGPLECKCAR
ncbi:hypothetical protein J2X20_004634 [Pelomonas saccharophila]|uniref:Uncharacterized protein n=1 Tax=Roseateles saccharophilus TaxID=304 RepID=A0ABU1YSX2_ROSSA|nr:hypothetical protein [Roseateles saccharophilus]MDR7271960.1 hypothetical protein [Roseateles saccharophilus]